MKYVRVTASESLLFKSDQITSVLKKENELENDIIGTYFFIP